MEILKPCFCTITAIFSVSGNTVPNQGDCSRSLAEWLSSFYSYWGIIMQQYWSPCLFPMCFQQKTIQTLLSQYFRVHFGIGKLQKFAKIDYSFVEFKNRVAHKFDPNIWKAKAGLFILWVRGQSGLQCECQDRLQIYRENPDSEQTNKK